MAVRRFADNPILTPKDVPPSRQDYEVIGVFNAGAARVGDEIILLLRVAERPLQLDPQRVRVPYLDTSVKPARFGELSWDRKRSGSGFLRPARGPLPRPPLLDLRVAPAGRPQPRRVSFHR